MTLKETCEEVPELKPVPGMPAYFADARGGIWSTKRSKIPKKLHPWNRLTRPGYLILRLNWSGEKRKTVCVHTMVCSAFHGPKQIGMQVRHLDGNNKNNAANNLIWGTSKENAYDRKLHGRDTTPEAIKALVALAKNRTGLIKKALCPRGHKRVRKWGVFYCPTCKPIFAKKTRLNKARAALAEIESLGKG